MLAANCCAACAKCCNAPFCPDVRWICGSARSGSDDQPALERKLHATTKPSNTALAGAFVTPTNKAAPYSTAASRCIGNRSVVAAAVLGVRPEGEVLVALIFVNSLPKGVGKWGASLCRVVIVWPRSVQLLSRFPIAAVHSGRDIGVGSLSLSSSATL